MNVINMGLNLDKQVVKSLGYEIYMECNSKMWVYLPFEQSDPCMFEPSGNIRDAWILVDELEKRDQMVLVQHVLDQGKIVGYEAQFFDYNNTGKSTTEFHESPPVAICKAGVRMLEYLDGLSDWGSV